jgi:hypothetical protein
MDDLIETWGAENSSDEQYSENVAAIQASIRDYTSGDRGMIAGERSAQLRREFGVSGQ